MINVIRKVLVVLWRLGGIGLPAFGLRNRVDGALRAFGTVLQKLVSVRTVKPGG